MMSYLKLQVADSLKLPWLRASLRARGIIVTLLLYCCAQENDGVIENCEAWTDEEWRDLLRLTRSDIEEALATNLVWWSDKGGLVSVLYDRAGQIALETKRSQAHHGGKGGRPKKNPRGKPIRVTHMLNPHTIINGGEGSPKGSASPDTLGCTAPVSETKKRMDLRALMLDRSKQA